VVKNPFASSAPLKVSSFSLPILFAVLPTLFLYAHNTREVSAGQILRLVLFSVFGALGLWLLLRPLMKNAVKTGMATTVCVIFFFSYGRLLDLLAGWDLFVPKHSYLLPVVLLVLGYCLYFIRILRTDFEKPARILNVVAATLIMVNLMSIALSVSKRAPSPYDLDLHDDVAAQVDLSESAAKPDIYYIILDEYAHPSTMLEYYDYDNSEFLSELVDQGFFIASNSTAANLWTQRAIASYLSMEYIPDAVSNEVCYQRIANSPVVGNLKSMGYRYVYFGSWFKYEVNADVYYNFYYSSGGSATLDNFPRTLWNTTMARPFYDHLTGSIYAGQYRSAIVETIQCLKMMPNLEGPKFVFAHVLCPHFPFVFGPKGEYVDPVNWYNGKDKRFYLGQYRFITEEIEGVIAALLEESSSPPIIILQSDHGLREMLPGIKVGSGEWQKVLNAYYFPGDGKEDLYDSISPVNSFRVVFNRYFGAHYDLLEDQVS